MFGFGFKFLDPGPLVDGELSLVAPSVNDIDEVIEAEHFGGTGDPADIRARVLEFLTSCPRGHQRADRLAGKVPAYHFWMAINRFHPLGKQVPVRMAGGIGFRVGQNHELEYYSGHIGYHVYPPAQGRHYAERATRLLLPLARRHKVSPLFLTCNPDNFASRRTIERVGAKLIEIVDIPEAHPFFARGERQKCRFRLDL